EHESGGDTAIVSASATDTTVVMRKKEQRPAFPYQELLDYARGRADDATRQRIDGQLKADPRWRAHLESVRYLDLEQLAARQDGEALGRVRVCQRTPVCPLPPTAARG